MTPECGVCDGKVVRGMGGAGCGTRKRPERAQCTSRRWPRPARLCLQGLKLWAHRGRVIRLLAQSLKAVGLGCFLSQQAARVCHPLQAPQGPRALGLPAAVLVSSEVETAAP